MTINLESPILKSYVKAWMRANTKTHIDRCGELDLTGLAESAADEFDVYIPDVDATIPEWVFDMSVDVGILLEEGYN